MVNTVSAPPEQCCLYYVDKKFKLQEVKPLLPKYSNMEPDDQPLTVFNHFSILDWEGIILFASYLFTMYFLVGQSVLEL